MRLVSHSEAYVCGFAERPMSVASQMVIALVLAASTLCACGGGGAAEATAKQPTVLPDPPPYPGPGPGPGTLTWQQTTTLQTGSTPFVHPMAAIDGNGVATLLWDTWGGPPALFLPRASRSASASIWSAPIDLETTPATNQSFTLALTGAGGSPMAAWLNQGAGDAVLRSSTFVGSWSTPTSLPTTRAGGVTAFATNASGVSVAVWQEEVSAGRYRLMASRLGIAGLWSPPAVVDPQLEFGDRLEVWPALAIDAQGNAMALWVRAAVGAASGTLGHLYASQLTAGSAAWSAPTRINLPHGSPARPQVVSIGQGRFVAAWEQPINGRASVIATQFSGSSWQSPALLENDDRGDAGAVQLAANDSGTVQLVWIQSTGTAIYTVWSTRFASGRWTWAGWPIAPEGADVTKSPARVGIDSAGNAIAIWTAWSLSGGYGVVEYSYLASGSARWTTPVTLSNQDASSGLPAALAMSPGGAVVVGWASAAGSDVSINARLLRP
jgi:hypothetical protein